MFREQAATGVSPTALVDAVLAHAVRTSELAPSTITSFTDVVERFAQFMERGLGVADVAAIGEDEVRAFIECRRSDGRRPSTSLMHNRCVVCRYLFRTAETLRLVASNPTTAIPLPRRTASGARRLTEEEMARCRAYSASCASDLRHPLAWALAEGTARTSEMALVLVGDVDLGAGEVTLPGSARTSQRTVRLTDWGLTQVAERVRDDTVGAEEMLIPFRSRKVPRASVAMLLIDVLRRAGIKAPDVRPMSVVAWRAASAYAEGSSVEDVARLLGMQSLDRTAALLGLRPDQSGR